MRSRGQRQSPARAGREPARPAKARPAAAAKSARPARSVTPGEPPPARRPRRAAAVIDADDAGDAAFLGERFAAIYQVVRRIPRGRVITYGQVAELAGMPGAARAVGAAMRASSPALGLPWQRVVGKRGPGTALVRIHDAMGAGMQRALLEAEGVAFTAAGGISLTDYGWVPPTVPRPRQRGRRGRGHPS